MSAKILKLKFVFLFLIFIILLLKFFSFAKAQGISLGIWPPLLEILIQPGRSLTQVYKISNLGQTDLVLTSKILPFSPADEFGNIKLETESLEQERTKKWFSFQNADLSLGENFVLKAKKTQQVVLKIAVPKDAQEKDYYFSLVFETVPKGMLGRQTQAETQVKIGTNILLTVSSLEEPTKKARIKEFNLANPQFSIFGFRFLDSFDQPEFLLKIENIGRSFFKPMGEITVNGWFGQKYLLDLLGENILANSSRQVRCQIQKKIVPCKLQGNFFLGNYRTRLEFGLEKKEKEYQAELTFLALPVKLFLGLLTIILFLFTLKKRGKFFF